MYVLRIHSRVFGVRWLLITPSTWGATICGTYKTPEACTMLDVPGASNAEPLARIARRRPVRVARTYSTEPRDVRVNRDKHKLPLRREPTARLAARGRARHAGQLYSGTEAGVELAGLGRDELPRRGRYLAEQRLGSSHFWWRAGCWRDACNWRRCQRQSLSCHTCSRFKFRRRRPTRVGAAMLACALGGIEGLHACAAPGQMHAARPARCLRGAGPAMQIGAELGNGELTYPFGLAARVGRDTYSDEWEEEEAYTPQVCHATQASNLRRADATDRPATHAVTL